MASPEKYKMIRTLLRALGLSEEAVEDIIDRIDDFLSAGDREEAETDYPYAVRDDFLSPAEMSFCLVLRDAVAAWAVVCPKVALGDLFYATTNDPSRFRTCTNRIDRKHVDFLLCDPRTLRPLLGVELDDKSHARPDRQQRDKFVEGVFRAARLPLARVPVRQGYNPSELNALLQREAGLTARPLLAVTHPQQATQTVATPPEPTRAPSPASAPDSSGGSTTPRCPKCGTPMVLRTAKGGTNAGNRFWGCPHFPKCRGILGIDAGGAAAVPPGR